MSEQEYMPTTVEVCDVWEHHSNWSIEHFDRWLAAIEAAAEQRGAIKALREFADAHRMPFVIFSGKDYRVTVSDLLRETARNIELGKYRADRMEGDDE